MWILSGGSLTSESLNEFINSSPRSTAIVGGAIVEDVLAYQIALRFPVEGKTKKELFRSNRTFGNFEAKMNVAYVMGIISKEAKLDLSRIMEIRNLFAHDLSIINFENTRICKICAGFTLIEKHMFEHGAENNDPINIKHYVKGLENLLKSPRDRFRLTIMLLHSALGPPLAQLGSGPINPLAGSATH
jgi:hypothetical protein